MSAVSTHCAEASGDECMDWIGRPADEIQQLGGGLASLYGIRGGRGILLCAGREAFHHMISRHAVEMGFDLRFRLLPLNTRIRTGLNMLAEWLGSQTEAVIETSETDTAWVWDIHVCPWCSDRQNSDGMCHFMIGLLQDYMTWASGNDVYLVDEDDCLATGGQVCRLVIDKQPVG
jgi:predicted hydrocarbon binding protein